MRFTVLGPLELVVDGAPIPVQASKQRVVLAMLLLRSGRAVSIDDLIEALWGDNPPAEARNALQVHVMRLRRVIGGDLLRTVRGGYAMTLAAEQLDLLRARDLVDRAARCREDGSEESERALLAEALRLWRGPLLVEVESESLRRNEITSVLEMLLGALERRVDLDLAAGRHQELIGELTTLTTEHPLRERFWAQLMLALYRSGQQAEALAAYRRITALLRAELGVGAGTSLRELHQAILVGSHDLAESPPRTAPRVVPAQLPPDLADFVGRADRIDLVERTLLPAEGQRSVPVTVISGSPGVGKTALAVRVAHRLKRGFPDGQLYVDLRGYASGEPVTTADVLSRFLRALGVRPEQIPVDIDEQSALYRSVLSGKRVLVVLDNASAADQVRALLPGDPGCSVLVTGRNELRGLVVGHGARTLRLEPFGVAESVALLAALLGSASSDDPAAVELAELCGHLPLALRIAGVNLAGRAKPDLAEYVTELKQGNRLAALAIPDESSAGVHAVFGLSYSALKAEARRLFRRLGLVPGPDFDGHTAAALLDAEPARASVLLEQLVAVNVLAVCGPNRYYLHDLLRLYAEQLCEVEESSADRESTVERLLDHYLRATDRAARATHPDITRIALPEQEPRPWLPSFDDREAAVEWLDAERVNLVAAARARTHPFAVHLADTARVYFSSGGHIAEWRSVAEVGLATARKLGDVRGEAAVHNSMARLYSDLAEYESTVEQCRLGLALCEKGLPSSVEVSFLNNLGTAYAELGDTAQAQEYFERSLARSQVSGPPHVEALGMLNLGAIYIYRGLLADAVRVQSAAVRMCAEHGFITLEVLTANNLGIGRRELGQYAKAMESLDHALHRCRELGLRSAEASVLASLAEVYRDLAEYDHAHELCLESIETAKATQRRKTVADAVNVAGGIELGRGRPERALDRFREGLSLSRESNFTYGEITALIGLADTNRLVGRMIEAVECARLAESHARGVAFRLCEGKAISARARIHHDLGEFDDAIAQARRAVDVHTETGHRLGAARSLALLGALGEVAAAEEAARIRADLGVPEG
ncbi:tetratricopeptide repeat protein [Allokutzneria sp. A3M-2-11 16]|uniref:AfsR/SARP family transcriptional regulator n=1 Tax=Allokutzneria sp. A3M-2-11 16 TaxID=2962043 RepID=UPI0020B6D42F|nr:BTAD domain-containing putative transcriptional regulator [Allokutzneria sp. A3M-2-11 16]MCP3800096.1 tetratricopeptide repeat protein [Allokutzneria sp. A3M-2-11 16]